MLKVLDWFDYLQKHKESTTLKTYKSLMNGYAEFLGKDTGELTIQDFNPRLVEEFIAGKTPRTANTFIAAVKSFAKWVRRNETITDVNQLLLLDNAVRQIEAIEFRKIPKQIKSITVTVDELKKILREVRDDDLLYSAILVHAYYGARPVELSSPFLKISIDPNNAEIINAVDFKKDLTTIVTAKTNRTRMRMLPYPSELEDFIAQWIDFVNDTLSWYKHPDDWFTKAVRKYGITAKTFRRMVETHFSQFNVPEWMIKYWLGHAEGISGEYRDKTKLIKDIWREMVERHYIFEVLPA